MLDIRFEINGRRVNANELGQALDDMLFNAVADSLREQLAGVRDPETGEFPVVAVRGSDLENLSLEISGSDRVVELAKERLGVTEDSKDQPPDTLDAPIKVFLSHATEDHEIAKAIATRLIENGIDTFFSDWEIRPGDSIRQKIDDGFSWSALSFC